MDPIPIANLLDTAFHSHQSGRLDEAQSLYEQILARDSNHADALHLLGILMQQYRRDSQRALDLVTRAIAAQPNCPEFHCNLGLILCDLRRWNEAASAFSHALELRPGYGVAANHLGNVLRDMGRLQEAAQAYHRAVGAQPDFFIAWNNFGNVLRETHRFKEAADACRRAVAINPAFASGHNNLGNALTKQDLIGEAIESYRRALSLDPSSPQILGNLANALKDVGRLDDAIATYRQALSINPDFPGCGSNMLYDLHYRAEFDPDMVLEESRGWDRQHAERFAAQIDVHPNDRDPNRRIIIGYVSPDFRQHAVSSFLLPLLKNHDHRQVQIICYANVAAQDQVTTEMRQLSDTWRDIYAMPDAQAAKLIRQDAVDILVDLAGHTGQSRLLLFARKPAPIQMSYLGYPGTTGLGTIDYRITDALADPPGMTDAHFRERLLRLPRTNWCFSPIVADQPVTPSPARERGYVCFGSFNNFAKVTEPMLHVWARLLQTAPGSRLLLKAKALADESIRKQVRARFTGFGIAMERLQLLGRFLDPSRHFSAYGQVDIALDTFPYNGTTTTCDALYMGVPVVTLAGRVHHSRVGVSLLTNMGLRDLIAQTPEQYVEIAAGLARDIPRLDSLRSTLRRRMQDSPLMDGAAFARDLEALFREAWRKWCCGHR